MIYHTDYNRRKVLVRLLPSVYSNMKFGTCECGRRGLFRKGTCGTWATRHRNVKDQLGEDVSWTCTLTSGKMYRCEQIMQPMDNHCLIDLITLTPYIVLPLFDTRFTDYAGGHPSLVHIATSLLIWYKMFCVRDISNRLMWMELINMFPCMHSMGRTVILIDELSWS